MCSNPRCSVGSHGDSASILFNILGCSLLGVDSPVFIAGCWVCGTCATRPSSLYFFRPACWKVSLPLCMYVSFSLKGRAEVGKYYYMKLART